jgi:hypothetical protein
MPVNQSSAPVAASRSSTNLASSSNTTGSTQQQVIPKKKNNIDPDQIISENAVRYNDFLLDYCQTGMSALSGSAAGILGLTGLHGFVFYFICSLILSVSILLAMGTNSKKYFLSNQNIFTGTLWSGIQTYLLFWTFLYGMVHVY